MRPFTYRCPNIDTTVITQLYAGMFQCVDDAFPYPFPCPCGHMHTLTLRNDELFVNDTTGNLPAMVKPLLPIHAGQE